MTMRSMPPASSHLAERPVPAPPPMIGSPRAAMARNLSINSLRGKRGMGAPGNGHDIEEGVDEGAGEVGVVDCWGELDEKAVRPRLEDLAYRGEQGRVRLEVVERLAWGVDQRHPSEGEEEADGTGHAIEPLRDPPADRGVLGRRRA